MRLPFTDPERPYGGIRDDGRLIDARSIVVAATPARAFAPIQAIGGRSGWYAGDAIWRLRGAIDATLGGPGPRRGRRNPMDIRIGDPIDWWRVEAYEPDGLLLLRAEMRVPGRAWLRFDVLPVPGGSEIRQTAIFEPAGRLGRAYWYGIWPLHDHVFQRMLMAIGDLVDPPRRPAGG